MPLANNALVLVTDGRKTLFFRNEGDQNQIDLRTEAVDERAESAHQVVRRKVVAAESGHVQDQAGGVVGVARDDHPYIGGGEARGRQPPGTCLARSHLGVNGAKAADRVLALASVLQREQAALTLPVAGGVRQSGVVVAQEDRGRAVEGDNLKLGLEQPASIGCVGGASPTRSAAAVCLAFASATMIGSNISWNLAFQSRSAKPSARSIPSYKSTSRSGNIPIFVSPTTPMFSCGTKPMIRL